MICEKLYLYERRYILALVSVHLEWTFNWTIAFVLKQHTGRPNKLWLNRNSTAIGGGLHSFWPATSWIITIIPSSSYFMAGKFLSTIGSFSLSGGLESLRPCMSHSHLTGLRLLMAEGKPLAVMPTETQDNGIENMVLLLIGIRNLRLHSCHLRSS